MVPGMFSVGGDYSGVASSYMRGLDFAQKRKQAADAAIDKWITDQTTKIDPSVIRKSDREAFDEMYNNWVSYGIQNKKEIARNPAVRMDFQNMGRDLMRFVEDSKNATKDVAPAAGWLSDPDKRNKVNRQSVIDAISLHEQPLRIKDPTTGKYVDNPNRQKIDYTKNYWNVAPPDINKLFAQASAGKEKFKRLGDLIPNDENTPAGKARIANEKILRKVVISYTPESIKEIGENAYEAVSLNPELLESYENAFENIKSKDEFKAYQDVLSQYFPGQAITDGASFAKAIALKKAMEAQEVPDPEEVEDVAAKNERRKRERAESEARADQRAAIARSSEQAMENVFDVINTEYSGGKGLVFPRNVGGKITKGVVTDSRGNLVTGFIDLSEDEIPANVSVPMNALGIKPGPINKIEVVDGRIISIQPVGGNKIDRSMIMLGQKEVYKPKKGERVSWGEGSIDPLGINEEE